MATRRRGKTLSPENVELLAEALARYRHFAVQCSNVAFNMAQLARTPENGYENTHQLVRDCDRAEGRLIEVLKSLGLYQEPEKLFPQGNPSTPTDPDKK